MDRTFVPERGSEVVERLVRVVGRAFYTDEEIMILDALLHLQLAHGNVPILASVRGDKKDQPPNIRRFLQLKEKDPIVKVLDRLIKDSLVQVEERRVELTDEDRKHLGQMSERTLLKASQKLSERKDRYYFIDFKQFYETTLYKVHMMKKQLQLKAQEAASKEYYVCNLQGCKERYHIIECVSLEKDNKEDFICRQCQEGRLKPEDSSAEVEQAKVLLESIDLQLHGVTEVLNYGKHMTVVTSDIDRFLNSADFMTKEEYKAGQDKAVLVRGGGPQQTRLDNFAAHHGPMAALARDNVRCQVVIDDDAAVRRKREEKEEGVRERCQTEILPPWLSHVHDDSYITALSGIKSNNHNKKSMTTAPHHHRSKRTKFNSNDTIQFDEVIYSYYVRQCGLDAELAEKHKKSQEVEFVEPEDYLRDRYKIVHSTNSGNNNTTPTTTPHMKSSSSTQATTTATPTSHPHTPMCGHQHNSDVQATTGHHHHNQQQQQLQPMSPSALSTTSTASPPPSTCTTMSPPMGTTASTSPLMNTSTAQQQQPPQSTTLAAIPAIPPNRGNSTTTTTTNTITSNEADKTIHNAIMQHQQELQQPQHNNNSTHPSHHHTHAQHNNHTGGGVQHHHGHDGQHQHLHLMMHRAQQLQNGGAIEHSTTTATTHIQLDNHHSKNSQQHMAHMLQHAPHLAMQDHIQHHQQLQPSIVGNVPPQPIGRTHSHTHTATTSQIYHFLQQRQQAAQQHQHLPLGVQQQHH